MRLTYNQVGAIYTVVEESTLVNGSDATEEVELLPPEPNPLGLVYLRIGEWHYRITPSGEVESHRKGEQHGG